MSNTIILAEKVSPKLETLTDAFSVAMYTQQVDRFDYTPGCRCPVCVLEGKISSIYGILEQAARASQPETAVA